MIDKNTNLERICAEVGFSIENNDWNKDDYEKMETITTKALGILIEDGLLAYSVWIKSRLTSKSDKKYVKKLEKMTIELLKKVQLTSNNDLIETSLKISENIHKILLARQLIERMLIYTRYRAKSLQKI